MKEILYNFFATKLYCIYINLFTLKQVVTRGQINILASLHNKIKKHRLLHDVKIDVF